MRPTPQFPGTCELSVAGEIDLGSAHNKVSAIHQLQDVFLRYLLTHIEASDGIKDSEQVTLVRKVDPLHVRT